MDRSNLDRKTVVELKKIAKSKGVTNYSTLRKNDLINRILASGVLSPARGGRKRSKSKSKSPPMRRRKRSRTPSPPKILISTPRASRSRSMRRSRSLSSSRITLSPSARRVPRFAQKGYNPQCMGKSYQQIADLASGYQLELYSPKSQEQLCKELKHRIKPSVLPLNVLLPLMDKEPKQFLVPIALQAGIANAQDLSKQDLILAIAKQGHAATLYVEKAFK